MTTKVEENLTTKMYHTIVVTVTDRLPHDSGDSHGLPHDNGDSHRPPHGKGDTDSYRLLRLPHDSGDRDISYEGIWVEIRN